MTDVYMDDKYIGNVDDADGFVTRFRQDRRMGKLPGTLNIYHNTGNNEISIEASRGRLVRPLIVVENGKQRLTPEITDKLLRKELSWKNIVEMGIVEYLDASEEENCLVAITEDELTNEHTHIEISPVAIFGLVTSLVPYANYGASARLNRGSKTQKQGLGLYASNFLIRTDTDVSVLHYPQKPITNTFMHKIADYDKHPSGQNVTIAVMSYEGYNMQDSIIFNKGSIDRGLARSTYYRTYTVEELRYSGGLVDEICIPDKEVKGYRSEKDYKHLEDDGMVYTGAHVKVDDVIIGKTSPPRFLGELEEFSIAADMRRESSAVIKQGEEGIVDMILLTESEEGNKLVQIRLRDHRTPEIGDKFASRYGQKGVIGMVIDEANVPFTASGVKPDLIFSPHSLPKRMTVSHLIEIIAGKAGALSGNYVDGTTFDVKSEEDIRKELLELGFREDGTEIMYNGITGEQFKARIYIGNMYYLKLKHMVANKLHARASGRIQLLTRQPIEGRSKGGGLRLGEMEKDCFVAHGASLLLKERFDSDKTVIHVCNNCGLIAVFDNSKGRSFCPKCGGNVEINAVELSYAFKLLLDELKSMMIYPKLGLKSKY